MTTEQQKLEAIKDGVGQAFADLIGWTRDISTQYSIEAGVKDAFTTWLDTHTNEIIEAIARNQAQP